MHAAFSFAAQHPKLTSDWHRDSQYLVLVSVPDEDALLALADRATRAGIELALWREPDIKNLATAVALQPGDAARRLCSNLPLHGRVREAVMT